MISPRAENLSESFEEWNNRSILGDNDTKLYFSTIYNIVPPPQWSNDHVPPYLSRRFRASPGVSRGGSAPFCWRSRNQQVPCESLVPFFSQERNCQCGRHEPTKAKTFLKFWFEAECILPPAPNGSLHKTKISLWACAAHSRASLKLDTISRFGLRKNDKLSTRQSLQLPFFPSFTTKFSNFTGVPRWIKGRESPWIGT